MGQKIAFRPAMGFTEVQRRLVHSYLGRGKVFSSTGRWTSTPCAIWNW